jgi:aspartyl protease
VPGFTTSVSDLRSVGPIFQVQIGVGKAAEDALRKAGASVPAPMQALAMIDTGATGTVISQNLVQQLGLKPIGLTYINTPSSTNVRCYEYLVRLLFPANIFLEGFVIGAPLQAQHIQCLIGRNILAGAVFVYVGYANHFTLSF